MNSKLNPAEQDLINKISASFNLDPTTKSLAIDFVQEYRQNKSNTNIVFHSLIRTMSTHLIQPRIFMRYWTSRLLARYWLLRDPNL